MFPAGASPAGHRVSVNGTIYLSPAPQAEPQALGFSSGLSAAPQPAGVSAGLSPAPQAEPQAAGFSSGLSAAPQAEPQAAAGASFCFSFHPKRFESAISLYLHIVYSECCFALCTSHCTDFFQPHKYALFYNSGYLFVTFVMFRAFLQKTDCKFFLCPSQILILGAFCAIMNVTS